jgi:uncharacterized Zn-binding protein involved in type VI secretion
MGVGLWAVEGDPNSHGGGELNADDASSPQTVLINNIPVIAHHSTAKPDQDHPPPPTDTAEGSGTVFVYNKPAHRDGHSRMCGATTTVVLQTNVYVDV